MTKLSPTDIKRSKVMRSYKPVPFKKFKKKALENPKVKAGYEELEEEFALIAELIKARKKLISNTK